MEEKNNEKDVPLHKLLFDDQSKEEIKEQKEQRLKISKVESLKDKVKKERGEANFAGFLFGLSAFALIGSFYALGTQSDVGKKVMLCACALASAIFTGVELKETVDSLIRKNRYEKEIEILEEETKTK